MAEAAEDIKPSRERRRHNRVSRATEQIIDAQGGIGAPWSAERLLVRMERHGDITRAQRAAGELFNNLFQQAGLDPLRAADMARAGGCGMHHGPHGSVNAERQMRAVIAILGGNASLAGSIAWHCLGEEGSIRQWAIEHGRDEKVAKGILVMVLDELARFWG